MTSAGEIKVHVTIDKEQVQEAARLAARLFRSEYAAAIIAGDIDEDRVQVDDEPPAGSTVTVKNGDVMGRHEDGWHLWLDGLGVWDVYRDSWEDILRRLGAPPRLATDADRERVGLPVDTARPAACCGKCPPIVGGGYDCTCDGNPRCGTDVDPDEALASDKIIREWRKQRARAEKAEADVERLTRERDEARRDVRTAERQTTEQQARYEALRADIADRFDTTPYAGTARAAVRVTLVGILTRDDERGREP